MIGGVSDNYIDAPWSMLICREIAGGSTLPKPVDLSMSRVNGEHVLKTEYQIWEEMISLANGKGSTSTIQ